MVNIKAHFGFTESTDVQETLSSVVFRSVLPVAIETRTAGPVIGGAVAAQDGIQEAPAQYLLESSPKLGVEDCVDDWIEKTVNVAEPDEKRYQPRLDVAQLRPGRRRVAAADGSVRTIDGAGIDHRTASAVAVRLGRRASVVCNGDRTHEIVSQTHRTNDVNREKRSPAEQKHTWYAKQQTACNDDIKYSFPRTRLYIAFPPTIIRQLDIG
jgi:hypothetical protein